MGIIKNMLKRKSDSSTPVNSDTKVNSFGEPVDKLIDGELPWGWIYANKDFTDRIQAEWQHLFNLWIDARNAHPLDQLAALKSLLQYAKDVQDLCDSKGECFSFWCSEILVGQKWRKIREAELEELESSLEGKIEEFNKKIELENYAASITDEIVIEAIRQHEGILQKDFYKLFDHPQASIILKEKLYFLAKDGKIKRTKQGNTYKLEI